jgi:hypothetical protein
MRCKMVGTLRFAHPTIPQKAYTNRLCAIAA